MFCGRILFNATENLCDNLPTTQQFRGSLDVPGCQQTGVGNQQCSLAIDFRRQAAKLVQSIFFKNNSCGWKVIKRLHVRGFYF